MSTGKAPRVHHNRDRPGLGPLGVHLLPLCAGHGNGRAATLNRYRDEPAAAVDALVIEATSLAVNERQGLLERRLIDVIAAAGMTRDPRRRPSPTSMPCRTPSTRSAGSCPPRRRPDQARPSGAASCAAPPGIAPK